MDFNFENKWDPSKRNWKRILIIFINLTVPLITWPHLIHVSLSFFFWIYIFETWINWWRGLNPLLRLPGIFLHYIPISYAQVHYFLHFTNILNCKIWNYIFIVSLIPNKIWQVGKFCIDIWLKVKLEYMILNILFYISKSLISKFYTYFLTTQIQRLKCIALNK